MSSNENKGGETVSVKWLGETTPSLNLGATFGLPWSRGRHQASEVNFTCSGDNGQPVALQTWITGYWPDGSIKWTAHAISASEPVYQQYQVHATVGNGKGNLSTSGLSTSSCNEIVVKSSSDSLIVGTGKITVSFATAGNTIVKKIYTSKGSILGENGHLVLLSQSVPQPLAAEHEGCPWQTFVSQVEETVVEQNSPIRAVVTVRGRHCTTNDTPQEKQLEEPWLPFTLRFYLYGGSSALRIVHTIIYDGNPQTTFIRGIGLRFDVPFNGGELHNRHVRFAGVDGGVLSEAVQGVTGLWRDPGGQVRKAQMAGQPTPRFEEWDNDFTPLFKWVPSWSDYTMFQSSPDGFTLQKRTKKGHSWVKIQSGTKAGGLAYLGSAQHGGLAVGLRHFWERYPTSLDIRDAAAENAGQITLWLYSPSAEPMDLRPYHDGLGQADSYDDQLDALKITYEDWEPELGSPYGIARTNEIYLFGQEQTPSSAHLAQMSKHMQSPPVLVADPHYIHQTSALGSCWSPNMKTIPPFDKTTISAPHLEFDAHSLESNLDFLFTFYRDQVAQRRWYGFWDHGDIMHTYDEDRHSWRYDIGGYAWDNSELSPDLWLWYYFLRTGREDVYRMAEALTRHTGEVDVYHIGPFRGLGTRHGVQHWSDSCKQARVSNALYRRIFYFISGGDERIGELLEETLEAEKRFLNLDPYRKVRKDRGSYVPDADALFISLGTDWSALASSWYIEWERRGSQWTQATKKLLKGIEGIAGLKNGFVTGNALYSLTTGQISPPTHDPNNMGTVKVAHLSAMFGLVEICSELIESLGDQLPKEFEEVWLDYCRYFNDSEAAQIERYGVEFGFRKLHQGHSRLTAYAAARTSDPKLALRAWREFAEDIDGFDPRQERHSQTVDQNQSLVPVQEAPWISTNIAALYGLAAIQNLAWIGDALKEGPTFDGT